MTVDVAIAEEAGLTIEHDGRTYAFCRSSAALMSAYASDRQHEQDLIPAAHALVDRGCCAMIDQRTVAPTEDPVCGLTVDPAQARERM